MPCPYLGKPASDFKKLTFSSVVFRFTKLPAFIDSPLQRLQHIADSPIARQRVSDLLAAAKHVPQNRPVFFPPSITISS